MSNESERLVLLKVYVPTELQRLVTARAEADDRSVSSWIRKAIVERLADSR